MTGNPTVWTPLEAPAADGDPVALAGDLLTSMTLDPSGRTSPSVYETGRLVALAPWLTGHSERVAYLLAMQRPDGGWGAPDGYGLVPTLSATEALLAALSRRDPTGRYETRPAELAAAADRGLRRLFGWLATPALSIPDTPAADLIIPALTMSINERLRRVRDAPVPGLDLWRGAAQLALPRGMTRARLDAVRGRVATGAAVPEKLLHAFEVVGDVARRAPNVRPLPGGMIGASPAATAAWVGEPGTDPAVGAAMNYLDAAARRQGGPVPCATPITIFERGWVLGGLARAGIPVAITPPLLRSLATTLGPAGTPTGPGLPADADTTAVALYALARLGQPVDPDCLWTYETGPGFCTWPGEDGFSITTNAHVLEALGQYLTTSTEVAPRYRAAVARVSASLRDRQEPDGSWIDRWHASPYYATACTVLALDEFGTGPGVVDAVDRAVEWVLASQRSDGSWGRWAGTVEETAYALQTLLGTRAPVAGLGPAVSRGHSYLLAAAGQQDDPPLWHDKDLYLPTRIARCAVLAALHMARARPDLLETKMSTLA
ncbi:hypothetical protein GCM10027290_28080 [Micromonospora sonneratiae]|uniref:Prenyltransferase/squalene oxidase repeat-containing protein n=1 Tax=Micromonospora sonneratiae TaxID=1184706 RepID=A0ABW3Y7F7_9ACTN